MAELKLSAEGSMAGAGLSDELADVRDVRDVRADRERADRERAEREVLSCVEDTIENLDRIRRSLAYTYSTLGNGTVAEFEVGEVLQAVRKAVVRARKGLGELAQQELPLPIV